MKKLFLAIIGILLITSCNVLWDVDTTGNVSKISCKPEIKVIGDAIISTETGGSYTEQGVEAYACDTPLTYTIVSGNVDPNTPGLYQVVYKATNGFGWSGYGYRTVLVYSGNPYATNIEGNYRVNFISEETSIVSKNDVYGFWSVSNVIENASKPCPVVMVEDPDNAAHFIVVPGSWDAYGRYSGSAVFSNNSLEYSINFLDKGLTKTYTWHKF